jgi:hypothetical protein
MSPTAFMKHSLLTPPLSRALASRTVGILLLLFIASSATAATHSRTVKRQFNNPPRAYATAPLWVWNEDLTERQIRQTLRDLASQKVRQAFVHPRPGLMTPYLSADWFRLWKIALDEAAKLDMNIWIYDENSYPSGFAGGWVPESMPAARGRGLQLRVTTAPPAWTDATLEVFRLNQDRAERITAEVRDGATLPDGQYLTATILRAGNSPWHGNRSYVDLLYPGVTERFLEITLEAYRREIGQHFGSRVPGIFSDEPHIQPAGGLPWTDDLPDVFMRRWGYSLRDHLPSLTQAVGDWRRVRHNYLQVLLELFIDRWAKPYYQRCEQYGLEFTGHYWEHEWPRCLIVPDNMALAAWQQRPGIDTLMNRYEEHTHAQFGNVRAVREISSVANQLGRNRTLCEVYGAGGWDLRFEDMKRIGDWLGVLGINTFDEHLSYVTLRGARKRDHPQSFSYHEPWWDAYHVIAQYLTRLSFALSHGEQINRILVLEPTTTAWMYNAGSHASTQLSQLGDRFFQFLLALEQRQVEYDLGCEDVIARHGSAQNQLFRVGQRDYDLVVLPPYTENLNAPTLKLLEEFLRQGGKVITADSPPTRVNGAPSDTPGTLTEHPGWRTLPTGQVIEELAQIANRAPLTVTRSPGDRGILFHQRREFADGQLLFLVNTSIDQPATGTVCAQAGGIERWDLLTGDIQHHPWLSINNGVQTSFDLPPSGSLLLFLPTERRKQPPAPQSRPGIPLPASATKVQRLAPNVLTLDYITITAGTETLSNAYYYAANQFAFRKNGMDRNPWDSAVQFRDELISRTFAANSGFAATYEFTIADAVPRNLEAVVERPDLYTITCNGHEVIASPGRWWLDRAFGRVSLDRVARSGLNTLTLKAAPFRIEHELEPVYLIGSFALRPADRGFVIAADHPLTLASAPAKLVHQNNPDNTMWLTRGIGFETDSQGAPLNDPSPSLVFDLGRPTDLHQIRVWNYAESHVRNLTTRGVHHLHIRGASADAPDTFNIDLGPAELAQSHAGADPQLLPIKAKNLRRVRFDILSNHTGVSYPATGEPADHGFVGLAEIEFLSTDGQPITGVTVNASSELASHQRLASRIVDRSGLTLLQSGWNDQGHPFYGGSVAYRQSFNIARKRDAYRVALGSWRGSVAKVIVNQKPAGYIFAPPWECDVTSHVRRGQNDIEIQVIGTLKNTLGPHHGNPGVGSAWPGMFQQGPEQGPPPGRQYHTLGYGLFEPFALIESTKK